MHQCACQAQSLFHTTGEGFDQCVPLRREINQFEQIIDGVGPFLARYAMYAGIKFEIFNCGEVRIDAEEVRHIANFPLNECRYLANFLVVKPNLTRGGGEKCCQNTYERCFTGSIRANQPINGAWCYLQVEIFECIDVAIAFRNMLYFDHIFVLLIMPLRNTPLQVERGLTKVYCTHCAILVAKLQQYATTLTNICSRVYR